jgi:putative zinc finger/helix-turn-helix YgiT family protein
MCNVSKRCPHTDTYIIKKDETYDVKGEPVAVEANVRVCKKCNEEIFDMKLDTENLKQAYQKYKSAHGLLLAEDIMRIRNKYKLGQRTFAKLIGCTQATLVRYEKGTIQNDTHNRLILLMDNPENLRETYRKIQGEFSESECHKIELALAQNRNKVAPYYKIS